jgi:diacylglycerol O-acyltransferase / wax synthase
MLLPMSPTSSMFLLAETRDQPMHVGSLQLFVPPDGADALDVRRMFDDAIAEDTVAPLFQKRPRRSVSSLGQWGWEQDRSFDLEHHVRRSALPQPGRVLELLVLGSRLHSTLLDRKRPLWEMHLVEGLADGRYGIYFKVHHSLVDGVSALRMLARSLSADADERNMPAPWAPRENAPRTSRRSGGSDKGGTHLREALGYVGETAGLVPAFARTVSRALNHQGGSLSVSAPKSMLNVPITGSRRFAAQSWPIERIRAVGKASDTTVNDVVLAMCSGALRSYMRSLDALPDAPLIAMVPVSLLSSDSGSDPAAGDGGGVAVGVVMCNLGTHLDDAGERLATVHRSMTDGKDALGTMTPLQILAMSALGVSPLAVWPLLRLTGTVRPPFNLVISNVPGPREQMYWNGARLDGLYPLSIPLDGQALNITCTSYSTEIAFGLTGCRRTVPHLQRLLSYLDDELGALEQAVGV